MTPERLKEIQDAFHRSELTEGPRSEQDQAMADLLAHIDTLTPDAELGAGLRELLDVPGQDHTFTFKSRMTDDGKTIWLILEDTRGRIVANAHSVRGFIRRVQAALKEIK